jgi:hypothetical protein
MKDLKSILRAMSERGTPVGSARLRERVVVELAGGGLSSGLRRVWNLPGPVFAALVAAIVLIAFGGVQLLSSTGYGFGESSPFAAQPTSTTAATPTTEAAPTTTEAAAVSTDVEFYEVTMELLGDEGFATTCGRLVMRAAYGSSGDSFVADGTGGSSAPRLFLSVSEELSWQRGFPEPLSGEGFGVLPSNEECHGGAVEGSPLPRDGVLSFAIDDDVIEFLWHYDYYYQAEGSARVLENFTIRGEAPVEWTESAEGEKSTEVSGEFGVGWFQNLDGEVVHEYEPFEGSPRPFHFRLTMTPTIDSISFEERVELDEIVAAAAKSAEAWNAAAQQLGVENLTLENGTSWRWEEQYESVVETVWEFSTETTSARSTHMIWGPDIDVSDPDEHFEIMFWLDSGYETEAGRSQLLDATRIMIRVMEPTLSDFELEDLASRLLTPEVFAEEEVGRTYFLSLTESNTWRWVLAQWID